MSASVTIPAAKKKGVWATIRARADEPTTWAGVGGVALVALNVLPSVLPSLQAAFSAHGPGRAASITVALIGFGVAIAKAEGAKTIAQIGSDAEAIVEVETAEGGKVTVAATPKP